MAFIGPPLSLHHRCIRFNLKYEVKLSLDESDLKIMFFFGLM